MQSFASFARTGVPNGLPRFRRANETDSLGVDVLQFELPCMEFRRSEQVLIPAVFENVRQSTGTEWFAVAQLRRQSPALPRPGAEPNFWLRLDGAQPGRGNLHDVPQPSWDGKGHQVALGQFERRIREFACELQSMLDAILQRFTLV